MIQLIAHLFGCASYSFWIDDCLLIESSYKDRSDGKPARKGGEGGKKKGSF